MLNKFDPQKVINIIADRLEVKPSSIKDEATAEDLGLDSLDLTMVEVEIINQAKAPFDAEIFPDFDPKRTVATMIQMAKEAYERNFEDPPITSESSPSN